MTDGGHVGGAALAEIGEQRGQFRRRQGGGFGKPRVVVRGGTIIADNLRRDRVTRAELESEMRLAGIASLRDVAWAIIEPQGKISFIKAEGGAAEQQDRGDPV